MPVTFAREFDLSPDEFADLLHRSTLAKRRPANDPERLTGMLDNADVIVTARDDAGLVIGISRAITDFNYCTYLSDLAVDIDHQRGGVGKRLVRLTHEFAGLQTILILLSAPAARDYYPHIGMERHDSCWIIRGDR